MNPPKNALLGHPIFAVPMATATVIVFFCALNDASWWLPWFAMLFPMLAIGRAHGQRTAYFEWKKAWDGMAEPARPQPNRTDATSGRWRPWAGGAMIGVLVVYLVANSADPLSQAGLVWLTFGGAVLCIVALVRRRGTIASERSASAPVSVCITRPLLPVPSLKDAYRALPDHSLTLLGIPYR